MKVAVTLVLTGLIGGGITYYYQERAQRHQQEAKDLDTARESALTFLREVGDTLEQRRASSLRCLYAIRDHAPPEETEQLWQDYLKTVNAWNTKWNLYRALVLEEFGPDMQKRFYDEQADAEGVWAKASLTAKLIIFHNKLSDYHRPRPDKPPEDPKQIEQLFGENSDKKKSSRHPFDSAQGRLNRKESERFKSFTYAELLKRDKLNLDIFRLKDESLEDSANLPDPDVIAQEIVEDLEAALSQFATIAAELKR